MPTHPDFAPLRTVELPHLRATALEFEHTPSGARLMHIACDDPENCFALAFATPPDADTGVPHILEHAVLAGSERFPVREPFFELVKSSPAGFINAMTSDVWTVYPITTTLEADFFNLADVYADAVFRPLLTRDTFEREGHHLELAEPGDLSSELVRSGIVYNEMKGAYSNSEAALYKNVQAGLFKGGPLGYDAGGDPAAIPQLTFEGLRDFYRKFYAPGNCLLFLYGDISTQKHLDYWGEKLSNIERRPSLASRPEAPTWNEPQTLQASYNVEPGSDTKGKTYLSLRWKCGDGLDPQQELAWEVLQRLLAGHDGAPLKKALVDSKLGADVFACRAETTESELTFHVALKGSEAERAEEFQNLVLSTLTQIADAGFPREDVETALRQVSYLTLEVASLFPLHLAMDAARYATCGADPLNATRSQEMLEAVRSRSQDANFFPGLIRDGLLNNPHRLLTVFSPDTERAQREVEREKQELASLRQTLGENELREIDTRAQELEAAQNEPNSPEALATLPRLRKGDLPHAPREVPTSRDLVAGFHFLRNDVFSNGIAYLHAACDVADLPPHLWKFLPRYTDAFGKMGANGQSWEQVAMRRAASTGGLHATASAKVNIDGEPLAHLRFDLKTLDNDADNALSLFSDLLFSLDPRDLERLRDVQTQGVAYYRDRLVNNAISTAMGAAGHGVSPIGGLNYLWNSPLTLRWMQHLTKNFDAQAEELMSGIEAVRDYICDPSRWTFSFTGSDNAFGSVEKTLDEWRTRMAGRDLQPRVVGAVPHLGSGEWDGEELPANLGLAAPLDVQFCARAFPAPSRESAPLVDLGLSALRFDYFLPEIRLKGNAYGGGASHSEETGVVQFYSYRDPRLTETLAVFSGAKEFAANREWTSDDLERTLLGNVSDAVPAIRPAASTGTALTRHLRGETPDVREEDYRRKLDASPDEVQSALLSFFEKATPSARTCVAASRQNLERANGEGAGLELREMLSE